MDNNWQMNKASIIVDASKYIQDLKQKVEGLNSELGSIVESSTLQMDEQPKVLFLVLLHKFFSYIKKNVFNKYKEYSISVYIKYTCTTCAM
jgi:hypothetical protein